jgi:hypothetical protein
MPQKRGEVVEKVDASQMMPNIYEKWLEKQVSMPTKARPGFASSQDRKLGELSEADKEEDEIDDAEDTHEKAHRRKRGKTTR